MADSTKNMFAKLAVKAVKEKYLDKEDAVDTLIDKAPKPDAPSMSNILQQCLSKKDNFDLTPVG